MPSEDIVGASAGIRSDTRITEPARTIGTDRLRWGILALLFASTVLNYLDRQALSLLAPQIQSDLGMTDLDYAFVVQAFLVAYTLAYLFVGRITDWLGTRLSLSLFVVWWSVANMATGLVHGAGQLAASRFALGLGEAGNYTAAPKAVGEWFAPKDRALGVGVYTAGAMVGATIAPPLIIFLSIGYGWRAAFLATGAAGFVWLAVWLLVYRRQPPVEAGSRAPSGLSEARRWREIVGDKAVWSLIAARMLTDPVWYFYLFWFPKFLVSRGLSVVELAGIVWIIYLAADFGSIAGGLGSGRLVRRGVDPVAARFKVMTLAMMVVPLGAAIGFAPSLPVTILLASMAAFAHLVWQVNLTSLVVDRFPPYMVASVFGLVAAGSGLGGVLSTGAIGWLVTEHSYEAVFFATLLLHPLGWLCVWIGVGSDLHKGRVS